MYGEAKKTMPLAFDRPQLEQLSTVPRLEPVSS